MASRCVTLTSRDENLCFMLLALFSSLLRTKLYCKRPAQTTICGSLRCSRLCTRTWGNYGMAGHRGSVCSKPRCCHVRLLLAGTGIVDIAETRAQTLISMSRGSELSLPLQYAKLSISHAAQRNLMRIRGRAGSNWYWCRDYTQLIVDGTEGFTPARLRSQRACSAKY